MILVFICNSKSFSLSTRLLLMFLAKFASAEDDKSEKSLKGDQLKTKKAFLKGMTVLGIQHGHAAFFTKFESMSEFSLQAQLC